MLLTIRFYSSSIHAPTPELATLNSPTKDWLSPSLLLFFPSVLPSFSQQIPFRSGKEAIPPDPPRSLLSLKARFILLQIFLLGILSINYTEGPKESNPTFLYTTEAIL